MAEVPWLKPSSHVFELDPAAAAGIVAGVVATVAQIILWWAFTDDLPSILYRDARLTAAIVMGPAVLPPPSTFDLAVMIVATVFTPDFPLHTA